MNIHPHALLLILVFIGATIRALRKEKIDPWAGLKNGFNSAATAWILVAGMCNFCTYEISLWVACVGAGLAYLGSEVLAAIDKYGKRVLSDPQLLLADWMPPMLKKVFTQTTVNTPTTHDDDPA